jgi:hypothetical protein
LALVQKALMLGLGGCVEWDVKVIGRLGAELAACGLTLAGVRKALIQHVQTGGAVVQVQEERETWKDRRDYWYKTIVPMPGMLKMGLFVEMELLNSDPELPEVSLVNAHEQH